MGAGTGTTCFGFKSGVGTSSRSVDGHALGCLVVSNYGARRDLHLLVGPDAELPEAAGPEPPAQGGSIMIVLGTDAPLSERQLRRLAARGAFGLGRAGSFATNASGEYVIAFSTAQTASRTGWSATATSSASCATTRSALRNLFEAAGEVVQESVLNSLCAADAMEGRDGNRAEAFPYELLERTGLPMSFGEGPRDPSPDPRTALRAPPRLDLGLVSPTPSAETHLPKALRLFAFVPYFSANAVRRRPSRSASHSLAAFLNSAASSWSCSSAACSFALAFCETHLPNALRLFPFVPYFSANALSDRPCRSALHSLAAFV